MNRFVRMEREGSGGNSSRCRTPNRGEEGMVPDHRGTDPNDIVPVGSTMAIPDQGSDGWSCRARQPAGYDLRSAGDRLVYLQEALPLVRLLCRRPGVRHRRLLPRGERAFKIFSWYHDLSFDGRGALEVSACPTVLAARLRPLR